jgi:hypothetical protein
MTQSGNFWIHTRIRPHATCYLLPFSPRSTFFENYWSRAFTSFRMSRNSHEVQWMCRHHLIRRRFKCSSAFILGKRQYQGQEKVFCVHVYSEIAFSLWLPRILFPLLATGMYGTLAQSVPTCYRPSVLRRWSLLRNRNKWLVWHESRISKEDGCIVDTDRQTDVRTETDRKTGGWGWVGGWVGR